MIKRQGISKIIILILVLVILIIIALMLISNPLKSDQKLFNNTIAGCTDPAAQNFDSSATEDNGSCIIPTGNTNPTPTESVSGCTDPAAQNFDSSATEDNGSCKIL